MYASKLIIISFGLFGLTFSTLADSDTGIGMNTSDTLAQPAFNTDIFGCHDKWIAVDKGLHFVGSMIGTIAVAKSMQEFSGVKKDNSMILGATFSFSLGLSKEAYDHTWRRNHFCFKDLTAGMLGIVCGVLLAGIK